MNQFFRGLIALTLLCGAADAADRAVIVGINSYPQAENADLHGARGDALRFYEFVTDRMGFSGDQVTLLLDEDATDEAIIDAIKQKLIGETEPGDRAVFYFSGHGARIADRSGDESDGLDEILIATNVGRPGDIGVVSDDQLGALFDRIEDRRTLIVIDSCHSGTATRGGDDEAPGEARVKSIPLPGHEAPKLTRSARAERNKEGPLVAEQEGRTVWSASAASQVAYEVGGEGVFTALFLEGISGHADRNLNGLVTNSELVDFVRAGSEVFCASSRTCTERNNGLTPEFRGALGDVAALGAATTRPLAGETAPVPPKPQPQPPQQTQFPSTTPDGQSVAGGGNYAFLTDLFASRNDALLRVNIAPSTRLTLGEVVEFGVAADRDGDLLLLDLDPEGRLFQIFPSPLSKRSATRLRAGEVVIIPEAESVNGRKLQITVTPPTGSGSLLAILIEDEIDLAASLIPGNARIEPIANGKEHLFGLARKLSALQSDEVSNQRIRWSAVVLNYEIGN